jgi:hypothetical protein
MRFHWEAHHHDWYNIVKDRMGEIAASGFTQVWLPPPTDSLAPEAGTDTRPLFRLNFLHSFAGHGEWRQSVSDESGSG